MVINRRRTLPLAVAATVALLVGSTTRECRAEEIPFSIAKIYWEYNASANDLGVHVSLDAEDWKRLSDLQAERPLDLRGRGPRALPGARHDRAVLRGRRAVARRVPAAGLLARFPEGEYEINGRTVDGKELESDVMFSHAIPDGPEVSAAVGPGDSLVISWTPVTSPPPGFPTGRSTSSATRSSSACSR